jgi:hypothetical protein
VYFVLITGILWAGLLVGAVAYELIAQRDWSRFWRRLTFGLLAALTLIVLITPLAYIRLHYAGQITSVVSSNRNDIKQDAQIYGARPIEYLLPAETNPILKALISDYAAHRSHHMSNPAEYTINLSLTLIAASLVAAAVLLFRWRRRPRVPVRVHLPVDALLLLACMLAVGALAFAFSLAPQLRGFKLPTWYFTNLIAMWRVFARLTIIVNLALVVTASVGLAYLTALMRRPGLKVTAVVLIFTLVALEYQTFVPPRQAWNYSDNVPPIYYRLHSRTDVHVVAEYPLDEPAVTVWPTFYQTYQRISGKRMINAYEAASPEAPIRGSIRTLDDPQTLPALRALGADTLITHGAPKLSLPGLVLIDFLAAQVNQSNGLDPAQLYPIAVYHIQPGFKAAYVVAPETGFVPPQKDSAISYLYAGSNGSTLKLLPLPGGPSSGSKPACFQIRTNSQVPVPMSINQGTHVAWSGNLTSGWQDIKFSAPLNSVVVIKPSRPAGFFLHHLGC